MKTTMPPVPYTRYKKTLLALNVLHANWCALLKENADLKKQLKERTVKPKFKLCTCGVRWIGIKSQRCLSCEMKRRFQDPVYRANIRAACQAGMARRTERRIACLRSINNTEPKVKEQS